MSRAAEHAASFHYQPTYYTWKRNYGGMGVAELKSVKELKAGHANIKRMCRLPINSEVRDQPNAPPPGLRERKTNPEVPL